MTSNLPLRSGKGHLYEGGILVPTIARLHGVTSPGSICRCPVFNVDYAPATAELADAGTGNVDGRSVRKLLTDASDIGRLDIFWHYPQYSPQVGRPAAAMRTRLEAWLKETGAESLKQIRGIIRSGS